MFCTNFADILGKVKELTIPQLEKDGSNKCDFYVADVLGNRKFAQNYAGFPRSDIALINEQQDIRVAKGLLESLADYSQPNINQGRSDAELLLSVRSKYCQTASEQVRYFENEIAKRDSARLAASVSDGTGSSIGFNKEDDPNSAD